MTRDEVPDPQSLDLWCEVDGHRYQDGSTKTMVYGVRYLVTYLSRFMTLEPGDVIATGTPPGVGLGVKPEPVFLRAGQVVRLGVDAAVSGDRQAALQCLLLSPCVTDMDMARLILDDYLETYREHLPQFWV